MATAARTSSRSRTAYAGLVLAALGLAGCNTPPVAPASTQILPYGDVASFSFTFLPNTSNLVAGEAGRLRRFVEGLNLRPGDSVYVAVPQTGSAELDAARRWAARNAVGQVPAPVLLAGSPYISTVAPHADAGYVRVVRANQVTVVCDNASLNPERALVFPPAGCSNTINRVTMAASLRDLTDPRQLGPMDASSDVAGLKRYQDGTTKPPPFPIDQTGNGN